MRRWFGEQVRLCISNKQREKCVDLQEQHPDGSIGLTTRSEKRKSVDRAR